MSNGSIQRCPSSVEPHATISVQDLVDGQQDHCGFLRKRGQKERVLENLHLSKHINWRQRFVVIKDGCCYCYADEVSKAPLQTFSLEGYNRIYRTQSDRAAFVFRLEPANTIQHKVHTFAATTDNDRVAWMQTFRSAMVTANDVTSQSSSETEEEDLYVGLEKPVFEPVISHGTSGAEGDSSEESEEEEESSDDSDYDRPDEAMLEVAKQHQRRRNVPLPPVPQGEASPADVKPTSLSTRREATLPRPRPPPPGGSGDGGTARRSNPPEPHRHRSAVPLPGMASHQHASSDAAPRTKPWASHPSPGPKSPTSNHPSPGPKPPTSNHPSPGPKPPTPKKPITRRLSERDCLFDNSDRETALEIIRDSNIPGTFLIRKSRQGDSKVLVVMTTEDVKEYKIFIENGQFSLDKKAFFPSMDSLLNNYSTNPLPNRQQTLNRSYSKSIGSGTA